MRKNIYPLIQYIFTLVILVTLCIPLKVAAQCMTYPISIEEKEKNASIIVLAKLKNKVSYWDEQRSRIYTLNIIEVAAYFKGNNGAKEIGVITTGGVVGMDALQVFPRFDIFPENEYIFFLQGDNQIIDHKAIRAKRPDLIQSETYADAQGALTKQFGLYSELHNKTKYEEQAQFDRLTQLTQQTITSPDGSLFLARTEADNRYLKNKNNKGELKLINPLFKDLLNNPSFSLLPINTMSPNPTNGGTIDPSNYVTFTGSGFGSEDAVFYTNADNGGATMVASSYGSDILSWTGSSIEEKVHQNAGSGPVSINGISSTSDLEINWSHNCLYDSFSGFSEVTRQRFSLVDMNNSGGYSFTYNISFSNNAPAKAAFERALETWRCATFINWQANTNTTSISSANDDNVNLITFNSGVAAGTLGRSYSYFSGTTTGVCNEENTVWWMREMDIEYDMPPTPTTTWNFGPAASVPFASTYDFESVSLHELGHLHGLGHTISFFDDVMHYALQNGTDKRTPSADDIAGGEAKMAYSTDPSEYCFIPANFNGEMIPLTSGTCSLTGGCSTILVNITGDSEFCEGESTDLDAGSYSAADSYSWSTNENSQVINVNTAGTYTVTVTDINNCTGTDSFVVSENDLPQPSIGGELTFCEGESTVLDAGSFYNSYDWSTGANTFAITVNSPGTYTVTVTDANGCTGSDEVTVIQNEMPQPQITGDSGFCTGESTTLSVVNSFQSYEWNTGQFTPSIEVATEGTYTITVTDSNNCSNTDSFVVFANTSPTPDIQGDAFFCNGESTTIFVADDFTEYIWSDGTITFGANIEESGTYTVTVTDNNGCTGTDEIIVVEQSDPNPGILGDLQVCAGESTTLTANGGFLSYIWSEGSTSNVITVDESGTYTLTVTNDNQCTGIQAVTVTVLEQLEPTIEGNLTICENENTLLILSQNYESYAWSSDESSSEITVNQSGTYIVTVTDANDCTGTDAVTVVVNDLPTVSIEGELAFCEGGNTELSISGSYTSILWSNDATDSSITVSEENTYSVIVTNSEGCTSTDEVSVVVNENPNPTIEGDTQICSGEMTILSVSETFNAYAWSNGQNGNDISVSESGTYTVTVTNNEGCTGTAETTVIVNALPTVDIAGSESFCEGESTQLSVSDAFEKYIWSNGNTSNIITVNQKGTYAVTVTDSNGCTATDEIAVESNALPIPNIEGELAFCENESTTLSVADSFASIEWSNGMDSPSINIETGGTYSVTVTNADGCTGTDAVMVVQNDAPQPQISGDLAICEGESSTLSVPAIYESYLWSDGSSNPFITVSESGVYSITVSDANGCIGTAEATFVVYDNPNPTISGSTTFCTGGSTTLDAGNGFVEYLWSTGETTQIISVNMADTYSVIVVDENGCEGSASIEVSESGELMLQIAGENAICDGESTLLDAGEGFVEYLWSTGETTRFITVSSADTYSVEVEDVNGCLGSGSIEVSLFSLPQVSIEGNAAFCEGGSTLLDAGNGFESYNWNTGETTPTIEVNQTGIYSVTVTNANDCSNSASFEVSILGSPQPTIEGTTAFCEGENVELSVSDTFDEYLWNTGEASSSIVVSLGGTYEVTVTDSNGCTGTTSVEVSVFSLPIVEITGSSTFCEGSNTTLSVASNFATYLWNTGATSPNIVVEEAGVYSVEVTDQNGCVNTANLEVEQTLALMPMIVGDLEFCESGNTLLDGGEGFFSHQWSTGETTRMINVTDGGTYSVTVTDASGCSGTDEVLVVEHTTVEPTIEGETDFCLGESTVLDAGAGFVSYLWNTGETSQMITVTTGGTYSVSTVDANGCSASAALTVQENIANSPIIEGASEFCLGTSTTLTAEAGYESYLWNTGETTPTITVLEEGIYEVVAIDENGCTATNEIEVTVLEAAEPTIEGALQFCSNESTTLTASSGYETYLWNTGETTPTITVSESGNYGVLVTDANGCTAGTLVGVEERAELDILLTGSATICNGNTTSLEVAGNFETYLWSTNATSKEIIVSEGGTYSVTVTDVNNCTGVASQIVTLSDSLEPTISGNTTICNAESTVLDAGGGFDEYLWNTGEATRTIEVSEAGNYTVQVSNVDGCSGTASIEVELIPAFEPNILGELTFCFGTSTQLIAQAGFVDYIWSNGDNAPITTVSETGTYTLVVTNENGCTGLKQVNVVELPELNIQISGELQITTTQSTVLDAGTYSLSDQYLWSTGSTEQTIEVDSPDTYSVTVTDVNGCSSSAEVTVELIDNIEDLAVFQQFSLLPNPFSERATLQFRTYSFQRLSIDLFSIEGRLVKRLFEGSVNGGNLQSLEIDGRNLPAGVYVLQLTLEDNSRVYERLVVTH